VQQAEVQAGDAGDEGTGLQLPVLAGRLAATMMNDDFLELMVTCEQN
jgi:hypothetical protein